MLYSRDLILVMSTQGCLLPAVHNLGYQPNRWLFQQDNSRVHTANDVKSWLADHHIVTFPWPSNSPDMNVIENAWAELERRVKMRRDQPLTKDQLWEVSQEEWQSASFSEYTRTLYQSMPRRMDDLWKNNGLWTKY